jgi:hypothetical protein
MSLTNKSPQDVAGGVGSRNCGLGALTSRGPSPDVDRLASLIQRSIRRLAIQTLAAAAGYDSEFNHVFSWLACGIRSLMPAKHGQRGKGPPAGRWRRRMTPALILPLTTT